ncbi:hypothetical protein HMN09_00089300 [Mycena chlorophos]|uniref:LIM zinc-binding domain-containing protein n=1 Tax=Mycena chlorophos TaxID=658473 RepID=A0A8H6TUK2_MYCCL|nr:hypothetical protein HMN09_00089300 [Mycena chlorophos]
MLSMSSSSPQPAGRMSQVLPTVKCSSCQTQLSLDELGSHVCAVAPPLPVVSIPKPNSIPKPTISPGAATSLLPQRLQGLVKPPSAQQPPPAASPPRNNPPISERNAGPPASRSRPTVNTTAANKSTVPPRRSPLAREHPTNAHSDPDDDLRSPAPNFATRARSGSTSSELRSPAPNFASRARSGSNASSISSPVTARPVIDERSVNTQSGGAAGMAGVGRRGFAAAARAAMFTTAVPSPAASPAASRAVPPRNIDTSSSAYYAFRGIKKSCSLVFKATSSSTPPLSTSTGSSGSPAYPESPPQSPPRKMKNQFSSSKPKGSTSLSQSSESEYGGLAYADSDDDEGDSSLRRANERGAGSSSKAKPKNLDSSRTRVPSPPRDRGRYNRSGVDDDDRDYRRVDNRGAPAKDTASIRSRTRAQTPPRRNASLSDSDSGSDYGDSGLNDKRRDRSPADSYRRRASPEQPRARNGSSESGYSSRNRPNDNRSNTKPSSRNELAVGRDDRGSRSPSPSMRSTRNDDSRKDRVVRKPKVCLRCEKKIEDGKWVAMDGEKGGVLCEKCWKNMYLPKCRRCNLPIEKQAVSSSDGQLKGKYHRECFNCHVCHKPFPDKTFYVHDHKPLCAYHYHEANDSLCAAARYHPEHMLCEYPNGCKERLEEYWEAEEEADSRGWAKKTRAMKRTTRYIELGRR